MNHADPHGWAGAQAQLHDAARAARQVADDREPGPVQPCSPAVPQTPQGSAPLMPAEPETRQQPRHPVHTLTGRQLRDYRRELEHALKDPPPTHRSATCSAATSRGPGRPKVKGRACNG